MTIYYDYNKFSIRTHTCYCLKHEKSLASVPTTISGGFCISGKQNNEYLLANLFAIINMNEKPC